MASGGVGGSPELLTATVQRDEHGYGMKVSGDNPVYVQSVKERGAAWRAGLRAGDKIVRVNGTAVSTHTHMQVVQMIRGSPNAVLTVQQISQRQKTPITAPVPVDREKQRQLEFTKVNTIRLMLENEQRHMEVLKNEVGKCGITEVRKRELESAEQRCAKLQNQIDIITSSLPAAPDSGTVPQVQLSPQPQTPKLSNRHRFHSHLTGSPPPNNSTGFLSGLPRSLSNLTGQSLRNLRQSRQSMNNKTQNVESVSPPQLERQGSNDENSKRYRHSHNNTVPMVPVTCLDGTLPPPLPPRSVERPQKGNGKRGPLSPPMGHLASPVSPINPLANPLSPQRMHMGANVPQGPVMGHKGSPLMSQSYQGKVYRRSSHSLDADFGGTNGQPNSIAMQMSYPLAVTHPPIQMGCGGQAGGMHVRSQSSPEHLDHGSCITPSPLQHGVTHQRIAGEDQKDSEWQVGSSPPGTPPPPYPCPPTPNLQPCMDSQRAIISMEEDDAPMSDSSPTRTGLFTSLRSVRESKARSAVLLNWLLGERRCARANLLLLVTDAYRAGGSLCGGAAGSVPTPTLRRWAYEIQSTFVMPQAHLAPSSVDENMAREIDEVLLKEYDKEEILRNVFRKARLKAKEELTQQLSEFQVKRQVGLGTLYGPPDVILEKCDVDKTQECSVVERLLVSRLSALGAEARGDPWGGTQGAPAPALPAAALAAAMQHALGVRPAAVSQALGGGTRAAFLQREKHYKQRVKQIAKQTPQPFIVRGHHLSLHAVMSVSHCHQCHQLIWGLAPQAYMCSDCQLTVHRSCARGVEESCCGPVDQNNRISRLMEKIHPTSAHQDSFEKKSRKTSSTSHFLNMERSTRKVEEEAPWDVQIPASERRDASEESLYESADSNSDVNSASETALTRIGRSLLSISESPTLAITDEDVQLRKNKICHRKTMSLSNPIEIVKSMGDEWIEIAKRELEEHNRKRDANRKKSKDSLNGEEFKENDVANNVEENSRGNDSRKSSKKEKENGKSKRMSMSQQVMDAPKKIAKVSSVHALNFIRKKKTPAVAVKAIESVVEILDKKLSDQAIASTNFFIEAERIHSSLLIDETDSRHVESDNEVEDSDENNKIPVQRKERRLSRTTSRSKSKVRGKSQSVKVNALRKSQSGTLKRGKKKKASIQAPSGNRSRQMSLVENGAATEPEMGTGKAKKKMSDSKQQNHWLFGGSLKGENRWEENAGAGGEPAAGAGEAGEHAPDEANSEPTRADGKQDAQSIWRGLSSAGAAARDGASRPVARAESCRAAGAGGGARGKQRNASDPNRLTAAGAPHHHHLHGDAETVGGVPSGSSSSSSLSSRSNESGPAPPDTHVASPSELSDEEEQLPELWVSTVPQEVIDLLSPRQLKRQELIHELITTERSHVRWLRVLQRVFVRPLERSTLLATDELRALFPNLAAVRERHGRLYADLRQLREVVQLRPLADALMATLGESSFSSSLARFCAGQRMALDALRERRRRCKELHAYLAQREQHPLCERRQLVDLLAAVWQRLTKYQLLLEQIVRTVHPEDGDSEEDVARLNQALDTAKDVLQSVDTAIRMAENQHRLRTIQLRMEVAGGGTDADDMKRLDLSQHTLLREGDLSIRHDANKKTNMLALLLQDCLVLLHRDGEKYILKQIHQPSQALLSPIVKWSTVLFRPNAAVKNGFFLVNIDGVKMYELSANTSSEYNTWTKIIQEMAISHRPGSRSTPGPSHSVTTDDSASGGGGVSRNPSNASQASTCSVVDDETPHVPVEPATAVAVTTGPSVAECAEGTNEKGADEAEAETETSGGKHSMERRASSPLELVAAVTVTPAAPTELATQALTMEEQLRRLNTTISEAMQAKCDLVGKMLGLPADSFQSMGDLAVLDTMGHIDMKACMDESCHDNEKEGEGDVLREKEDCSTGERTMHQLLLAAQTQANQLTEILTKALSCTDTDTLSSRQYNPWSDSNGLCDLCASGKRLKPHIHRQNSVKDASKDQRTETAKAEPPTNSAEFNDASSLNSSVTDTKNCESLEIANSAVVEAAESKVDFNLAGSVSGALEKEISFDMLSELEGVEESERRKMAEAEERLRSVIMEQGIESDGTGSVTDCPPVAWWSSPQHSSAQLARTLTPAAGVLQGALGELLVLLPGVLRERDQLRAALRGANERSARLAHAHRNCLPVAETDPADLPMDHKAQDHLNGGG